MVKVMPAAARRMVTVAWRFAFPGRASRRSTSSRQFAIDAAKEQGINTKALSKVAKEMLQDSDKLRQKIEDEAQLDLFREKSGLLKMKGLAALEPAE